MDFARIILRDLGRNSRRTIMTITSIAVSLFVFCGLMSFAYWDLHNIVTEETARPVPRRPSAGRVAGASA
jgi:cell division protein FtsX